MAPILIVLCILAFIFWFWGRTSKAKEAEMLGAAIIAGMLIAIDIMLILASFDIVPGFTKPFLIGWAVSIFFLIGFYQSGGPPIIYTLSLLCIIFGYLFTGPYSGYMKHYVNEIKAPLRIAYRTLAFSFHDLMLMLTNPQQYIYEQQQKAVKIEAEQTQPKGVEIKAIVLSPDQVPSYQKFYIQVRAENEGSMKAEDVSLNLTCIKDKCEGEYNYNLAELLPNEAIAQQFGPFLAKEEEPGKTAEVNITLRYNYFASSSLIVEIMNEEEIKRLMADPIKKYELFRNVVATGKASPAMLALSVGEQPLFNGTTQVLTASVVNKRIGEKEFVILTEGTRLNITLPSSIGQDISCSGRGFECDTKKTEKAEVVACNVVEELRIPPQEFNKQPVICQFTSSNIQPEQISRSDLITAELSRYTFEITQTKGPTIMMTAKCAKESKSCKELRCCGSLKCCEDKICRIDCEAENATTVTPELGAQNYCEWKKQSSNDTDKWCQEAEGNCKEGECSTTIVSESGQPLECRSDITGIIDEKEIKLDVNLCCFKDQDNQSCLEDFIRRGGYLPK
ncbi:MAG: hypothetical protein QXQ40_00265 [Candidatus Aenigmatarchaeota archaeon]